MSDPTDPTDPTSDTTTAAAPRPRASMLAGVRGRLRRVRWLALGIGVLLLAGAITAAPTVVPEGASFPEVSGSPAERAAHLRKLAIEATDSHQYTRAWDWFRQARDIEADAGRAPGPVTDHELTAGYESGAARNMLYAEQRHQEFAWLVQLAMEQDTEDGGREMRAEMNRIADTPDWREIIDLGLRNLYMRPTLRRICRLAIGLPAHPSDDPPGTGVTAAAIRGRLRDVFAFVRDTVTVVPDREHEREPGDYRHPIVTLFEGYGSPGEVNWLLVEAITHISPFVRRGDGTPIPRATATELHLAPPAVRPHNPLPYEGAATEGAAISEAGAVVQPGPGRLVVVLVNNGADQPAGLYAFDIYAGVPLLDSSGELLDLFHWLAGRADLHPSLQQALPYGREPDRLRLGASGVYVSPGEFALNGRLDQWLRRHGIGHFDPPLNRPVNGEVRAVIRHNVLEGRIPTSPHPEHIDRFPTSWRWQPLDEMWINRQLTAARGEEDDPHASSRPMEREARTHNRSLRQVVLDYRRPGDAIDRFARAIYKPRDLGRLQELSWPQIRAADSGGDAFADSGRGVILIHNDRAEARPATWDLGPVSATQPVPFLIINTSLRPMAVARVATSGEVPGLRFEPPLDGRVIRHGGVVELHFDGLRPGFRSLTLGLAFVPVDELGDPDAISANRNVPFRVQVQLRGESVDQQLVPDLPHPRIGIGPGVVAATAGSLMPLAHDFALTRVGALQSRFGAGWSEYQNGDWMEAERSMADYLSALAGSGRRVVDRSRLPALWMWQAHFLRGRALAALGRHTEADREFEAIPTGAPLGVAARLAEREPAVTLLQPPEPSVAD